LLPPKPLLRSGPTRQTAMTRIQANLILLLTGALWGMGFVAQSTAMAAVGPLLFTALRCLAAVVAILPLALWEAARAEEKLATRDWRIFALIGAILFAGMTAQQVGLLTTTVTNSGFLTGLYVVMVPFLAIVLFRDWPHVVVWPAAFAALAGIGLLSGGSFGALTLGDWLTILCALLWAFQLLFIARYANRSGRPVALALAQFIVCAVLGFATALPLEPVEWAAIRSVMPEVLYTGVFSGGLAFTLQAIGQRHTTAPQAAIFLASEAVFAALFGAIFLGERLPPVAFLGCGLIFSAILAVELVPALMQRRRVTP
jgi:drug/metabolite transporter (DMT)-like permease